MSPNGRVEVRGPIGLRRRDRINAIGVRRALPEAVRLGKLGQHAADEAAAQVEIEDTFHVDVEDPGRIGD